MWHKVLAGLLASGLAFAAEAAELRGVVRDNDGGVRDAVIHATPLAGAPALDPIRAVIDQVEKLYTPFVSAFAVGTTVNFPNNDNIKHHLYSVSKAKRFERPLYTGQKAAPVLFDKAGEVTLGCNIHDWMIAHILVLNTPYAAITDGDGRAVIAGLPPGDYAVRVWHPGMKGKSKARKNPRKVTVSAAPSEVEFKIRLRPKIKWWRAKPTNADREYNSEAGG
ncbi:MAG: hypothetical protein QF384_14530 [Alphaproteobacteria bacterium]|jgi:plastocyanin|nr:hypothetical protein [Alphaproteobacteria bacterium]MDP6831292.1 hypothetical protein [Alphaproteobacteria bacterium]MDP6876785.1 hypothetical protein [Alphaproteobacteria bacterium]